MRQRSILVVAALMLAVVTAMGCGRRTRVEAADLEAEHAVAPLAVSPQATGADEEDSRWAELEASNRELAGKLAEVEAELARREKETADVREEPATRPRPAAAQAVPHPAVVAPEPQVAEAPAAAERPDLVPASIGNLPWESERVVRPPAPPAAPPERWLTVAPGAGFEIEILQGATSDASVPGDRVSGHLAADLVSGGELAVRAGARVEGRVVEARPTAKVGGRAVLGIELVELLLPNGERYPMNAFVRLEGERQTKRDALTIGGATIGGAVLGRILGKSKGAAIGTIAGAAAGTAVAAKSKRGEIDLEEGARVEMTLQAPLRVRAEL